MEEYLQEHFYFDLTIFHFDNLYAPATLRIGLKDFNLED